MEVRCNLCGVKVELSKVHKDYQRLAQDPEAIWVCPTCQARVRWQARESGKEPKPL